MVTKAVLGWPQPSTQDCHARPKSAGDDADGRNASLLNGNHVMGKPRRASASMGGGTDNGIHLGGFVELGMIDMGATAERRTAGPEVAPVAFELDVWRSAG